MLRYAVLAVLVGISIAQGAEPPAPDPKNPVDYVAWMNEGFKKDLKDNAADLYQQAITAFVNDDELAKLAGTPAGDWTAQQREKAQAWVDRNREALDKFTAASAKRRCYFELHSPTGAMYEAPLPHLVNMRALGRLLAVRVCLRSAAGDFSGATEDGAALCGAAQHLEAQPAVISYLVGIAIRALANAVLIDIPSAASKDVDYASILTRLEKVDADPKGLKRPFLGEKIMAWDIAQRYLKDADGDGRYEFVNLPSVEGAPQSSVTLTRPETWDETIRSVNDYYGGLEKAAGMEYGQAYAAATKLREGAEATKGSFISIFGVDLSRTITLYTRATAQRRGTLLVLRMHAYRAKSGKWPSDLNAMLPKDEPLLGTDPFSGQPFVYRLEKDEPHLYSVSENGKDDGGEVFRKEGKPACGETGDYVFWPLATK